MENIKILLVKKRKSIKLKQTYSFLSEMNYKNINKRKFNKKKIIDNIKINKRLDNNNYKFENDND